MVLVGDIICREITYSKYLKANPVYRGSPIRSFGLACGGRLPPTLMACNTAYKMKRTTQSVLKLLEYHMQFK